MLPISLMSGKNAFFHFWHFYSSKNCILKNCWKAYCMNANALIVQNSVFQTFVSLRCNFRNLKLSELPETKFICRNMYVLKSTNSLSQKKVIKKVDPKVSLEAKVHFFHRQHKINRLQVKSRVGNEILSSFWSEV